MSSMEMSNLTKNSLGKMFSQEKRFDGRGLLDLKDFSVETGIANTAEGSARVKLGKTDVVVGIKLEIGEPYPDSMDKGNLVVSGDLLPMASPRFESGPPGFDSIEMPRLIDRMIRESGAIDMKKLVVKEGEKVWTIYIDIYPINDDGSLIDAASIATLVALKNTILPGINDGRADYDNRTKNVLPTSKDILPLSFTFYKINDSLFLQPTREEEEVADCKVTFGVSKWNGDFVVNSAQKGWETTFTKEEIEQMMETLPKKYEEVIKKIHKVIK